MRISDWSSDVCSSDLGRGRLRRRLRLRKPERQGQLRLRRELHRLKNGPCLSVERSTLRAGARVRRAARTSPSARPSDAGSATSASPAHSRRRRGCDAWRSEEHPSELQSLMRTSYAVFLVNNKQHDARIKHYGTTRTTIRD